MTIGPFLLQVRMKTADLLKHFSAQTTLPVDVNDVLKFLRENGNDDEIEFIGVDLNPDVLQGQIEIFYVRPVPYGDPVKYVNIYYDRQAGIDAQRFICCKELLHVLDPNGAVTNSSKGVEELAEQMGLTPEMYDFVSGGSDANVDRLAEFRAAAILFPLAVRQPLIDAHREGKMSIDDIARLTDIPRKYVGFVMNAGWTKVHEILLDGALD